MSAKKPALPAPSVPPVGKLIGNAAKPDKMIAKLLGGKK